MQHVYICTTYLHEGCNPLFTSFKSFLIAFSDLSTISWSTIISKCLIMLTMIWTTLSFDILATPKFWILNAPKTIGGSMGANLHWRPVYYNCLQVYGYFDARHDDYDITNSVEEFYNLPIYIIFHTLFPNAILLVFKYISIAFSILTLSNVVEGFLYLKTFLHIRR